MLMHRHDMLIFPSLCSFEAIIKLYVLYTVSHKKENIILLAVTSPYSVQFTKCFTCRLSCIFIAKSSLKKVHHTSLIATLPSEILLL